MDSILSGGWRCGAGDAFLLSGGIGPPLGSALWQESQVGACQGGYTTTRLELAAAGTGPAWCAAALAALSPALDSTCCSGSDQGSGCGLDGRLPAGCDENCAELWGPLSAACPQTLRQLLPSRLDG